MFVRLDRTRPVYLSVDIDVLDPSAARGTAAPEPPGISSAVLFDFLYSLAGLNVVALDVNEILPEIEPAGITAITGAKLIREATILFAGPADGPREPAPSGSWCCAASRQRQNAPPGTPVMVG